MIRRAGFFLVVLSMAVSAAAQPSRTLLVRERRLPEAGKVEAGLLAGVEDTDFKVGGVTVSSANLTVVEPYVRYGAAENLAVHVAVPLLQFDPDWGRTERGLGDLRIGAEILVFEDIFRYPWIMPYAQVSFPTGSESKGLGAGEFGFTAGIAIGTQMYDNLGFVLDGRYEVIGGGDNRASVGSSVLWDLSRQFSLQAELRVYEGTDGDDSSVTFLGGMVYWPSARWMVGAYGGIHTNGVESNIGAVKVSYLLP